MARHRICSALLVLISLVSAARADDSHSEGVTVLRGLDPISLVRGNEVKGDERFAATHGRYRYLFSNAENRAEFAKNPSRYAVQGDRCTVMPKVPASPDLFLVHDGKIFLFGSEGCKAHFEADPAAYLKPGRSVAILVYEGMELLDFAGPGEVFTSAGRAFDVFTVAVTPAAITSQGFVTITPRYSFADCPKVDLLVIPGGATRIPLGNATTIEWIRKISGEAEVTLSVCNGALLLAKAGRIDNMEVTTHHESIAALKRAAPKTTVREGVRFVDNGRIVTSAGVSAGTDAALHIVERLIGSAAATEAARAMEYPWQPQSTIDPKKP